jgi:putative ABC transport system permease protein
VKVPYWEGRQLLDLYSTELAGESAITSVSGAWEELGAGDGVSFQMLVLHSGEDSINGFSMGVSGKFLETMKINLIAGKSLSNYTGSEEEPTEVLVNEALVRAMSWDDPLGKPLSKMFTFEEATVVGVVQDFNFQSLHQKVEPLALHPTQYLSTLYIKITVNNIPDKVAMLEEKWQKIAPDLPFTYQFLDDFIQQQYQWEKRWAVIVQYASVLSMWWQGLVCSGFLCSIQPSE